MSNGWIKIHRKMLDWGWYNDINVKVLFIHILLTANFDDKGWQGLTIKRGQLVTSREHLAEQTKLTVQQVRTALNKLKSTNEITIKTTNKYTIITINKYDEYQDVNQQDNQQITNKQPTNNQQITTTKEYKNIRNKEDKEVSLKLKEESTNHALKVLGWFNQAMGTNFKSIHGFESNLEFWSKVYSDEDIQKALLVIRAGKWWAKDPSPTLLFRRKTPKGEPVDYIGELLNLKGGDISVE